MAETFSIVIPCFNEERRIGETLDALLSYLSTRSYETEVIVVNDGSTDGTADILAAKSVTVITHERNCGYGASIKTGVRAARYPWILLYDGDGQHMPEYIDALVKASHNHDMVVGAREGYQGPALRQPGKRVIRAVAEYLSEQKIPDFNSGLRLLKRSLFDTFVSLYPDGFSLSTTLTIAALQNRYKVAYVPIRVNKREGSSTVRWSDAVSTLMLVSRLIALFSPLKLFSTIAAILFIGGCISLLYDLMQLNLNEATLFLLITALLIYLFGLLADQIAEIRKHLR